MTLASPSRIFFKPVESGWQLTGLESDKQPLHDELTARLAGEIRVAELPRELPVVGHVAAMASWFVFFKAPGRQELEGVLLSDEEYRSYGLDPYRAGAAMLGSQILVDIVADSPEGAADERLAAAYARFLAGETSADQGIYSSYPLPLGEPDAGWAEVQLLRVDQQQSPETGPDVQEPVQDRTVAMLKQLEQRLTETEEALQTRTRLLAGTLVVAILLPLLVGYMVWSTLREDVERLELTKVEMATLVDGLLLNEEQELSAEDALLAKLHDLATVSVQSGAWQSGLHKRGVDPSELLDTLVVVLKSRRAITRLTRVESALGTLARAEPALSSLAASREPLIKLAESQESLAQLTGAAGELTSIANQHTVISRLAEHEPAVVSLAKLQEPLTAVAEHAPELAQLRRQRTNLLALAGRRAEIESQLQQAATLDTMITEMARVLTFMEHRQGDLEQLCKRKDAVIQLTDLRNQLADLARKQTVLNRLAGSCDVLMVLADDIYLRRMVANEKALSVLSSRLDDLAQLTLHADQLVQLVGAS
jgi:hypothetical protein